MRLDISIGPVQGFVAQSRRTRDLWGSSYLLSFLSAHAMHGTVEAGGRIDQPPIYDDPLYRRVAGGRAGDPPTTGSLPNHFVSHVDGDAGTVARAGAHALDVAWRRVCDAVRTRFVAHASDAGDGTDRIWQRQIGAFWEVTWTAGNSLDGGGLLARRKRWRSHRPPDEPGDKCTVMHDLQELSGYVRAQNRDARQRQDGFWDRVRERLGALELRDNERLCAIALVKRLFPRVATAALGWPLDTSHWPSTVYIGATPWLRRVVRTAPESARQYAEAVQELGPRGVLAERRPPFAGLDERAAGDFARLDGNYLHHECLQNARLCPLADDVGETAAPGPGREHRGPSSTATRHPHATTGATTRARRTLDGLLAALYDTRDETDRRLGAPASFYALLLADGDRLGRLVGTLGRERGGTSALDLHQPSRRHRPETRRRDGLRGR